MLAKLRPMRNHLGVRIRVAESKALIPLASLLFVLNGCARFQPQPISPAACAEAFDARSLSDTNLLAFLDANQVAGEPGNHTWDVNALTLVAFFYQPALAEARAQWTLARSAQISAGERPNPSFNFTPEYDTTTSPAWILGGALDFPVETAAKRGRRMEQAGHFSDAARWNLLGVAWQVHSAVRGGLLDLYAARETESLLASQATAQSNVVQLLAGQLHAGGISEFEVTQARIAFANSQLALQGARRQQSEALVKLADALGLPAHALQGVQFSFAGLDDLPMTLTAPEVRKRAVLNRADIREALAQYAASQSALQLEIAKQYPDINLSPGYQLDQTDNKWSLGLTVTLPILNQNQGPIAEARSRRELATAHLLAVQAKAIGEIDRAMAVYSAALNQSGTAASLLRDMQVRMTSVREMQQAGQLDPLAVANARVEFNGGELARLDALVNAQRALGQLEDATQSAFEVTPAILEPSADK